MSSSFLAKSFQVFVFFKSKYNIYHHGAFPNSNGAHSLAPLPFFLPHPSVPRPSVLIHTNVPPATQNDKLISLQQTLVPKGCV